MEIDFPDFIVNVNSVSIALVCGIVGSLLFTSDWSLARPPLAALLAALMVPAWLLVLASGLELFAQGYQTPIDASDVSEYEGRMPRRGGLMLLIIRFLPYFLVGYGGLMLFLCGRYLVSYFRK